MRIAQEVLLHVSTRGGYARRYPFDHAKYPGIMHVTARKLANWAEKHLAAAEPPPSPVDCAEMACGPEETITLVPYGSTNIRMSGLPWVTSV